MRFLEPNDPSGSFVPLGEPTGQTRHSLYVAHFYVAHPYVARPYVAHFREGVGLQCDGHHHFGVHRAFVQRAPAAQKIRLDLYLSRCQVCVIYHHLAAMTGISSFRFRSGLHLEGRASKRGSTSWQPMAVKRVLDRHAA